MFTVDMTTTKRYTVMFDEYSTAHSMTRTEAFAYLAAARAYQHSQGRGCGFWVARRNDDGEWVPVRPTTADERRWAA